MNTKDFLLETKTEKEFIEKAKALGLSLDTINRRIYLRNEAIQDGIKIPSWNDLLGPIHIRITD